MLEACFSMDGDSYVPGPMARGPWGAAMGGQVVGGLLGWGIERDGIDPGLQPARLTVDLLRPVLLEPVQIRTSVVREGRRIKLVDAAMVQGDKVVARASALFLRRGEHPDVRVWSAPAPMPSLPPNADGFFPPNNAVSDLELRRRSRRGQPRDGRVGAGREPEVRLD